MFEHFNKNNFPEEAVSGWLMHSRNLESFIKIITAYQKIISTRLGIQWNVVGKFN